MVRFKSKKKHSKKVFFLTFSLIAIFSFVLAFTYLMDPELLIDYVVKNHFTDNNESITNWFFKGIFGSSNDEYLEETIGKVEYIPDPNPSANQETPLVYIYNTHQKEEYDGANLMEHDVVFSVMTASYILREKLNQYGIKTMVETNDITELLRINGWNYNASYKASRLLLENARKSYPSLAYFLDIHRDSITYESSTLKVGDISYAKVLFVIGIDQANYAQNETLALKISEKMNQLVPGISRGILPKGGRGSNGVYNQDFHPHTILIEVGSSYNKITEVNQTIDILAQSIKSVLEE